MVLSQPAPTHGGASYGETVRQCLAKSGLYTPREIAFLESMSGLAFVMAELSPSQSAWLADLAQREPLNYDAINAAAMRVLLPLLQRWLPTGKVRGREYVALNPMRADSSPGSFTINITSGKWGDFAADARGGDPISLAAYLHHGNDQRAAALALKGMLGI